MNSYEKARDEDDGMKKKIKNYIGNKLLDFVEFIHSLIPDGEKHTEQDKEDMKTVHKLRLKFKDK